MMNTSTNTSETQFEDSKHEKMSQVHTDCRLALRWAGISLYWRNATGPDCVSIVIALINYPDKAVCFRHPQQISLSGAVM